MKYMSVKKMLTFPSYANFWVRREINKGTKIGGLCEVEIVDRTALCHRVNVLTAYVVATCCLPFTSIFTLCLLNISFFSTRRVSVSELLRPQIQSTSRRFKDTQPNYRLRTSHRVKINSYQFSRTAVLFSWLLFMLSASVWESIHWLLTAPLCRIKSDWKCKSDTTCLCPDRKWRDLFKKTRNPFNIPYWPIITFYHKAFLQMPQLACFDLSETLSLQSKFSDRIISKLDVRLDISEDN